eukprot:TRINITY_DN9845_c0_g1_i1.p1 TRINITY_DN9845_c0_g1~~TRINITY_DN9845_c0_g1_i1.p1  ORF type:complete len:821 (+),score=324.92 TRINITY_DN9845_c0_g1_i1:80-2542(+)
MKDCAPWRGVRLRPFDSEEGDARDVPLKKRRGASLLQVTDDGRLLLFGGRGVDNDVYTPDAFGLDYTAFNAETGEGAHYLPLAFACDEDEQEPDVMAAVASAKVMNRIRLGGRAAKGSYHTQTSALHEQSVYVYGGYASPAPLPQGFQRTNQSSRRVLPLPYWDQHFFELDLLGLKWHQIKSMPAGDPRRRGHTAVVYDGAMYVFGGWGPQADWWRNDTDCYTFATGTWSVVEPKSIAPPPRVALHTASVKGSTMWVFGGYVDESPLFLGSVMGLEGSVRREAAGAESEAGSVGSKRLGFTDSDTDDGHDGAAGGRPEIVALNNNSKTELLSKHAPKRIVEGAKGEAGAVQYLSNAVFAMDLATGKWQRRTAAGDVPPARACHTASMYGDSLIVVGGEGPRAQSYNDIYVLDTTLMLWTAVRPPANRPLPCVSGHAAAIVQDSLIVLGGGEGSSYQLCYGGLASDGKAPLIRSRAEAKEKDGEARTPEGQPLSPKDKDDAPQEEGCACLVLPLPALLHAATKRKAAAKREIAARCDLPVNVRKHPREVLPQQRTPLEVQAVVSRLTSRPADASFSGTFRSTATSRSDERTYGKPKRAQGDPPERPAAAGVKEEELLDRLYTRAREAQDAQQKQLEGRYLKPVTLERFCPVKPPDEIDKLTQALCDDAVRNKQNVHTALLNNRLQMWQGSGREGKWVAGDWQTEHAKEIAKIKNKPKAGDVPPPLNPVEEDMVKRFYSDRRPANERQVKQNEAAFLKHNPQRKPAKKLDKDGLKEINERFYAKPLDKKANKKPFVDKLDREFKVMTKKQWEETVSRLNATG